MKAGHWLVALIVVAAPPWWPFGHPGHARRAPRPARFEAGQAQDEAAKPKLYKWHDAKGTLQLTDKPPKGRKYTVVDVEGLENDNVIPMGGSSSMSADSSAKPPQ